MVEGKLVETQTGGIACVIVGSGTTAQGILVQMFDDGRAKVNIGLNHFVTGKLVTRKVQEH